MQRQGTEHLLHAVLDIACLHRHFLKGHIRHGNCENHLPVFFVRHAQMDHALRHPPEQIRESAGYRNLTMSCIHMSVFIHQAKFLCTAQLFHSSQKTGQCFL